MGVCVCVCVCVCVSCTSSSHITTYTCCLFILLHMLLSLSLPYPVVQANYSSSDCLIPPVYVPLNPDECMCRSVQAIVLRTQQQPDVTCTQNFNCTGVTCQPSIFNFFGGTIEGDIRPCTDPPSFVVSIRSGSSKQLLFRRSFTHSELANITIPGLPPVPGISNIKLNVTVIEQPYSEIVQVCMCIYIGAAVSCC